MPDTENLDTMIKRPIEETTIQDNPVNAFASSDVTMTTGLNFAGASSNNSNNSTFLTPEEAAQFETEPATLIDPNDISTTHMDRKVDDILKQKDDEFLADLNKAVTAEDARLENQEKNLSDSNYVRENVVQNTNSSGAVVYNPNNSVNRTISENDESYNTADPLLPSYDEDELTTVKEDKAESTNITAAIPKTTRTAEETRDYVKSLSVVNMTDVDMTEPPKSTIVSVLKEKRNIEPVDSKRIGSLKSLDDSAFLSAAAKFKRQNFRTVSVPLINSGFNIDIVGSGAVDLNMLYGSVDENTPKIEYDLQKMGTIIKNVVGTDPKIPPTDLKNMIHYADYNIMAYAHVCATLKTINAVTSCNECGADFRVEANSTDLIMNMDEIRNKWDELKSNPKGYTSLMTQNIRVSTPNTGFIIDIGHPSYAEYVAYLETLKRINENETYDRLELDRIGTFIDVLPYIRSIIIPQDIRVNTLYQKYQALTLLDVEEYESVVETIRKEQEKVVMPRFGIKSVKCPHCGKENKDITWESVDNLVFFHIMVSRLLSQTEQK